MILRLHLLVAIAAVAVGVSGCSVLSPKKDPTRFYELTLATNASTAPPRTTSATLVLSVEVAGYLQNPSLVQRVAPNQVSYFPFDQWAQPFGEGVTQVIRTDLGRTSGLSVTSTTQSYVTRDAYRVDLQLRRLDVLPGQQVQVAASWQIRTSLGGERVKQGEFNQQRTYPSDPTSLQGAVAVFSDLLGELSRALLADLP